MASLIGIAFDAGSGDGELTSVFSALFVIGCVAAVLVVRQSSVFTAVIQPPLILFALVPGAYFLMHAGSIEGIKDILINCGYPLIERFPLMFFTSAAVLLLGLGRWYLGAARPLAGDSSDAQKTKGATAKTGRVSTMLAGLLGGRAAAKASTGAAAGARTQSQRRRGGTPAAARAARGERSARRTPPPSRRPRPDETDAVEQAGDRPRRRRPRPDEAPSSAQPRRRPRGSSAREQRRAAPGAERRAPYDGAPYDRASYDRASHDRAERFDRERPPRPQQRRSRYDSYQDGNGGGYGDASGNYGDYEGYHYEPYESPREPARGRANSTHHPVSRVRYRGADDADGHTEYRTRRPRSNGADRWEYDI